MRRVIIQQLTSSRVPELYNLVSELLSERYNPEIFIFLKSVWPEGQLLLHGQDGYLLGFLLGTWVDNDESRILMFGVRPEYRSMGLGSLLLDEFMRRTATKKGRAIRLEVRPENGDAVNFYIRRGFHVVGMIPRYYRDGGDGIMMRRLLNETSGPRYVDYACNRGTSPSGSPTHPRTALSCRSRSGL